jgi:NAD(P)-dependent dehydrogenase (short-subunit alcohol dehydrogenase family)
VRLTGSVGLVTGGASGLGRATAERLVDDGAQVVICDLPGSDGAAVAEKLGAVFAPTDVTSEADVRTAVAAATELGPLRVVVNCAGVPDATKVLDRSGAASALDRFSRTLSVNLIGHVQRHPAGRRGHDRQRAGGRGPRRGGVHVVRRGLRRPDRPGRLHRVEGGHRRHDAADRPRVRRAAVRVVSIAPGMFETPLLLGLPEAAQRSLAQQVPHPSRMGHPAEFADCVAFVVGNPMINGETIRLDGAIRMAPK